MVIEQRQRESKIENSAPPVGLEPTTSCILDKHTTTVLRGRLQVVGDGSHFGS